VYENSKKSKLAEDVIVATDSDAIFKTVIGFGGKAVMTSKEHASGTDRIAEAAGALDYDIIVNVQGDEPLIRAGMIDDVIRLLDDKRAAMGTLIKKIEDPEEVFDPNVVKAVFDKEGFAMYFSRAPIPFDRDEWKGFERFTVHGSRFTVFKHLGIYSYRRDVLLNLAKTEPVELEKIEKLEQLRALVNGFRIKIKETTYETVGVDTPQDLERVKKWLSLSS
jgi:3-deoxy-manno-octulosonate cytidylyltransferase (CMP-KDO synthetase)